MSRAGMAGRWTLFAGAALSVCLGVALVQSSLLLLVTAATYDAPAGPGAGDTEAAVALLGITLSLAVFLAVFIISSTFAFTVEQRRRELALLRLVGGNRAQVRRLLLGEAVLLGLVGAALGVPAGVGVMAVQGALLRALGFVPDGFAGQWRTWILAVSVGTGLVLAVSGVLAAARRAGRVRPLEALRDTGAAARTMTAGRWLAGAVFLAGAVALIVVAPHGGPAGGQAMASNVPLAAAVAAAALSPLLVPAVARLVPVRLAGVTGLLALANLRDGRRRSAAVAAPVIVLVALVFGTAGALGSFTAAGIAEQRRDTAADLVVDGPAAAVPGVAAASVETEVEVTLVIGHGEERETDTLPALVIDPEAYARLHPGAGPLPALREAAVAAGPGGEVPVGQRVGVRLAGRDLGMLPVVRGVPEAIAGGPNLLLPAALVRPAELAGAPARTFVALAPGADPAAVRAALGTDAPVYDVADWLAADAAARTAVGNDIMVVLLGLGGLYALIGVVNAVVIGAAARRREFAAARATGLTRGQVVRAALLESVAVGTAGVVLGVLAAGAAFAAVRSVTDAILGHAVLDVPWTVLGAVTAAALLATAVTSVLTSWSATRPAPVTLLGARE